MGQQCERPSLPLLMWLALPLWLTCAWCISIVPVIGYRIEPLALCVVIFIALFVLLRMLNAPSALAIACIGVVLGALLAYTNSYELLSSEVMLDGVSGDFEVELLEDPRKGEYSTSARGEIRLNNGRSTIVRIEGECLGDYICHDIVSCRATFAKPDEKTHERLWQSGCSGTLKVRQAISCEAPFPFSTINDIRRTAIDRLGALRASPLAQALACGWRQELIGSDTYTNFKLTGLAHLVAVSGAHLVIVTTLFAQLLKILGMHRIVRVFLLFFSMISYFLLAGAPVSAFRALVMTTLGLVSFSARRRPHVLNALAIVTMLVIAADPSAALSLSFALSALSTLGIVLFSRLISEWCESVHIAQFVAQPLGLTVAASIFTLPLSASTFSQVPLIAPISNVLAAPLFAPSCAVSLIAGLTCVIFPPASSTCVAIATALTSLLDSLAESLSRIPHCCIPASCDIAVALGISLLIAGALWIVWPVTRKSITKCLTVFALLAVLAFLLHPNLGDALVMIDVGQGDSFLLTSKSGSILIDTGKQDASLLEACGRYRILSLDACAITHSDEDHCGSLEALAHCVPIDHIVVSGPTINDDGESSRELMERVQRLGSNVFGMKVGDWMACGPFSVVCIAPSEFLDDGGNADSLCLVVGYDADQDGVMECSALLAGDAEADVLERLCKRGILCHVDILKVSHHGSSRALSRPLLECLKPKIALISCGKGNPYGHPAQETLDLLDEFGVETFRTDLQGEVVCSFSRTGITVAAER